MQCILPVHVESQEGVEQVVHTPSQTQTLHPIYVYISSLLVLTFTTDTVDHATCFHHTILYRLTNFVVGIFYTSSSVRKLKYVK